MNISKTSTIESVVSVVLPLRFQRSRTEQRSVVVSQGRPATIVAGWVHFWVGRGCRDII